MIQSALKRASSKSGRSVGRCFQAFMAMDAETIRNSNASSSHCLSRFRTMSSSTSSDQPATPTLPSIGFVGLGNMGMPMTKNLASSSGDDLLVFDTQPNAISTARAIPGVKVANSLQDLAEKQVIITMLPGDAAVDAVLETLHAEWTAQQTNGVVVIDCSTVSPMTSQKWSNKLQDTKTATLFDAPVSGGVKGATDGTLTFMLGGCAALSDVSSAPTGDARGSVKTILEQMGSRVIECGDSVGTGAATKLCNNLALAAQMIGICEALNLGEALGVDPEVLTSVLNSSTASCWSSKVNNPHPAVAATTGAPASRNYQGGFATNLMLKDLGLAMQVGSAKHVALPLTSTSKELYQMASLQERGLQDFGVMLQLLRGDDVKKE